jgi:hypothetical protein
MNTQTLKNLAYENLVKFGIPIEKNGDNYSMKECYESSTENSGCSETILHRRIDVEKNDNDKFFRKNPFQKTNGGKRKRKTIKRKVKYNKTRKYKRGKIL